MKRNTSGTALGIVLVVSGIFFAGYEIFTKVALFGINFVTSFFMIGVGLFFVSQAGKGKSASHLLAKEDIGKFTLFGSFGNHLIFVFALFGLLLLFILLVKLGLL